MCTAYLKIFWEMPPYKSLKYSENVNEKIPVSVRCEELKARTVG